jgi:hypothetical protein
MSDPYNTADAQAGDKLPPPLPGRRAVGAGKARRGDDESSRFGAWFSGLLPVWNVLALLVTVVLAGGGRRTSLVTVLLLFSPLALAIVANIWVANRGFATVVRVLNAVLAVYVLFKLLRYMRMDIYTFKMLLMFITTVCVPALNAVYLNPAGQSDRPRGIGGD